MRFSVDARAIVGLLVIGRLFGTVDNPRRDAFLPRRLCSRSLSLLILPEFGSCPQVVRLQLLFFASLVFPLVFSLAFNLLVTAYNQYYRSSLP